MCTAVGPTALTPLQQVWQCNDVINIGRLSAKQNCVPRLERALMGCFLLWPPSPFQQNLGGRGRQSCHRPPFKAGNQRRPTAEHNAFRQLYPGIHLLLQRNGVINQVRDHMPGCLASLFLSAVLLYRQHSVPPRASHFFLLIIKSAIPKDSFFGH